MIQYQLKISGRVQGVGYRYFAQQKAKEIGMKGWVKNTREGEVEIVAQGTVKDINTFIDYLQIGPRHAKVSQILKVKMPVINEFYEFEIRF